MQTAAAKKLSDWFNDRYDENIQLDEFSYAFPSYFQFSGLLLPDDQGDTIIFAEALRVDFRYFLQGEKHLELGEVQAEKLQFNYITRAGDSISTFSQFINKLSSQSDAPSTPFSMYVLDVEMEKSSFSLADRNCADCQTLTFKDISLHAGGFDLTGSEFDLSIELLRLKAREIPDIHSLRGDYRLANDEMFLRDFELITPLSNLAGDLQFRYESISDLSSFVEKVSMEATIEEGGRLASSEINMFSREFPALGIILIEGRVEGKVDNFKTEDLFLSLGEGTALTGSLHLKNVTRPDSLYLNSDQLSLQGRENDISWLYGLFTDSVLPAKLRQLGDISFDGSFTGFVSDFSSRGEITTGLGKATINMQFLNPPGSLDNIRYKGQLKVQELQLGELLEMPDLGSFAGEFQLNGRALDPRNMNTSLKARIYHLDYNRYRYRNIKVDGQLSGGDFTGELRIDDPNLRFAFQGNASFGKDSSRYDFVAQLDSADLHALNFTDDSVAVVSGEMDINFIALNYEKWEGEIKISNTTFENHRNFYFFEDILIQSQGLDTNRSISVQSNIVTADVVGNYTLAGLKQAFLYHLKKYVKNSNRIPPPPNENFRFNIDVNNTLILTEIFYPELYIEPGSRLVGSFSENTRRLKMYFASPGFNFRENTVENIDLLYEGSDRQSQLNFSIDEITLKNGVEIDSLRLGNYFYQDTLFYDLRWVFRDSIDSRAALQGYALQQDSLTFEFGVDSSGFNIGQQQFAIHSNNRILLDTAGVHIEDLIISNEGRSLVVNGNISNNRNEILRVNLQGFGLEILNYFMGSQNLNLKGELYGDLIASQLMGDPKFAANLRVDSIYLNNRLMGDLSINSDWSYPDDTINLIGILKRGSLETMKISGYYQPDSTGSMGIAVDMDNFPLATFEPFVTSVGENLRGMLDGNIVLSGTTGNPEVNGELVLYKAGLTISFLQTDYNLTGTPLVKVSPQRITFDDIQLRDTRFRTAGILSGEVRHQNFRDFDLDLEIDADELLVLNTEAGRDEYYYGRAYATGLINIDGRPSEMEITANVSTARDTRFYIPLDAATTVKKSEFVTFINPYDTLLLKDRTSNPNRLQQGISINFNIDVDPNAEVNIIIDQASGTRLTSHGNGNINLRMAPYSDMTLDGSYTVFDGDFYFTLQNIVRRKFEVQQGGSITWNGDPYGAIVDITARYETRADPGVILSDYNGGKTLVYVDLYLSGELLDPNISFDISTPRANSTTQAILTNIVSSENQVNQQVFSLLLRNSFAPEANFFGSGVGGLNTFDILAQQAAGWINHITGDYQVSLAYQGTGNENAQVDDSGFPITNSQEEVEVGVSKKFFDDRVTINGSVGVPIRENQNQIAGDFEIEYNISEDGRLRAKVFNRSVQNQFSFSDQNYQQGIGLFYRVDFDTWGEFLYKLFNPIDAGRVDYLNEPGNNLPEEEVE